jgi:hypothetical protein
MRFTPIFAAILAFAGIATAAPAAAETALTKPVAVGVFSTIQPTSGTTADQYRDRRWRGDRWRGDRGWRGDRWRGGNRYRGGGWRYGNRWRGVTRCRTSWRYGRPYRVCWRR